MHLCTGKFSGICHASHFTRPALMPIHTCSGHKPLRKCDMYKMESWCLLYRFSSRPPRAPCRVLSPNIRYYEAPVARGLDQYFCGLG